MPFNLIEVYLNFKMKLYTNIYVFNLVLLLSFFSSLEAANSDQAFISSLLTVNACATVNCGQGTCQNTDSSVFGFECDCYSGWKKFQLGPIVFPPCIIPNCTLNFDCGNPSPPSTPPPFNLSDPCTFSWCGEGSCKTEGTGYECDCNAGSDNFLNVTTLPCFKECSVGADCGSVRLGKPPASDPNSSPPGQPSSSPGLRELKTASTIEDRLKLLILGALIFLPWI